MIGCVGHVSRLRGGVNKYIFGSLFLKEYYVSDHTIFYIHGKATYFQHPICLKHKHYFDHALWVILSVVTVLGTQINIQVQN